MNKESEILKSMILTLCSLVLIKTKMYCFNLISQFMNKNQNGKVSFLIFKRFTVFFNVIKNVFI